MATLDALRHVNQQLNALYRKIMKEANEVVKKVVRDAWRFWVKSVPAEEAAGYMRGCMGKEEAYVKACLIHYNILRDGGENSNLSEKYRLAGRVKADGCHNALESDWSSFP